MKTCLYNVNPLKTYFYEVKLGFTEVCIIFLISVKKKTTKKHRLWVLARTRTHNFCFEQKYEKNQNFYLKTFSFWW